MIGLHPNLPNADYHAMTDWWSSTQLKRLLPEWHGTGAGSRDALDFGSAFHARALGSGEEIAVVEAASWRSKAAEEARAEADQRGAIPVLAADSERIDAMCAALRDHPTASALLYDTEGTVEESAFWVDDDGLQHKARFDRRIPNVVIDLKSTAAGPGTDSLTRAVTSYGYDVSAAHYMTVANGLGLDIAAFVLIFVTKTPPHYVTVAALGDEFLTRGHALRRLALHRATDPDAPAYDGADDFLTLNPPTWAMKGIPE